MTGRFISANDAEVDQFIINEENIGGFQDFDCGRPEINDFIKKQYILYFKWNLCVGYGLKDHNDPKFICYYTLSATSINSNESDVKKIKKDGYVPAIRIGYIGVEKEYLNKGWGFYCIRAMVNTIREKVRRLIGVRVLMADAIAVAVEKYQKWGFEFIQPPDPQRKKEKYAMFLNLNRFT